MGVVYVEQRILMAVNKIDPEMQIAVAVTISIKVFHPHSRAFNLRGTTVSRCCHLSDLTFLIRAHRHKLTKRVDEA